MIGKTLGHYQITDKLGEGGMGVVYKARDAHLDRFVAIKVLPAEKVADPDRKRRFVQEAKAASALNHPNIVTIHDITQEGGTDFIVMEYVVGKTLHEQIPRNGMQLSLALMYAVQIADALARAHGAGIVHRDLKPSNVMVDEHGLVKVLDFGLAKLTEVAGPEAETATTAGQGAVLGTAAYMSPEQAEGKPIDTRSDIFSFGSVLYEMLTGQRAFRGESLISILAAIIKEDPAPLNRRVPEALRRLIERCLRKDLARRSQTIEDVKIELEEIQERHLLAHAPKSTRRVIGSVKNAAPLGALILVVLVMGGVLWRSCRRTAPDIPTFEVGQVTGSSAWEGEPEISPEGNRIVFSSNASGNLEIYVTDLSGAPRLNITNDPADDKEPAWFPDSTYIAFTSRQGGRSEIRKTSPLGGGATLMVSDAVEPAISPDGSRIAYTQVLPNGYRVAVAPLRNPTEVTVLSGALGETGSPAWSPDSRTVCYIDGQDLWIVEAVGGHAPTRITTDGIHKYDPAWSPDGRQIYYSSLMGGGCALWCVASRGGTPVRVTDGISDERHPSLSKDGKRLICATSNFQSKLVLLNRHLGVMATLPVNQWVLSLPAIAADGSCVVFTPKHSGPDADLWAEPLKDGNPYRDPMRITDGRGNLQHPALSPDGRWIACYRVAGNEREIVIVSSSGGKTLQITHCPPQSATPAWSPDGSMIAFASYTNVASEIVTMRIKEAIDSLDPRRLGTPHRIAVGSAAYGPVWSPDGKRLAFVDRNNDDTDIWLVPADGSARAFKLTRGANAKFVRWDSSTGDLLVSGAWGGKGVTLCRVSVATGMATPFAPGIEFGGGKSNGLFDLSLDAKWLVFSKEETVGQISMLKATKGVF